MDFDEWRATTTGSIWGCSAGLDLLLSLPAAFVRHQAFLPTLFFFTFPVFCYIGVCSFLCLNTFYTIVLLTLHFCFVGTDDVL